MKHAFYLIAWVVGGMVWSGGLPGQTAQPPESNRFQPLDVFELEHAADPRISPDGAHVVYARTFRDIMTDGTYSNLWLIRFDGSDHRPLTTGLHHDRSPRWSPDGKLLAYVSDRDGKPQIYLRWMDTGAEARLSNLQQAPSDLSWSPDGRWIAFSMFVPEREEPFVQMPPRPENAKWAPPAQYIDRLQFRSDGRGFLEPGYRHLFLLPVEGGTPRQLTFGPYNHGGRLSWTPDGKYLLFSANRHEDWEYEPRNTEVFQLEVATGELRALTDRHGPDNSPQVSPDGKFIAYLGSDERYLGYQPNRLYVMNRDGSNPRALSAGLDRNVSRFFWAADSRGLVFQYDSHGNTQLAHIDLNGALTDLAADVGGLSIGRPYSGGTFSLSPSGRFAYTHSRPDHPADLAVGQLGKSQTKRLTHLNQDLFAHKKLGEVEELWYTSEDGRRIQGWICKPPDFDPLKKYPLILEIHGGPFANYGDRFSAEVQLYAAAGYVVLYTNPSGSTSYGAEFGNLIHHNYPGPDYADLLAGVDAVLAKGYVDPERLFVTGGSGGGVLTAWIVGHTDRFRAAVVAKPVINWYSFVLHADATAFFYKYWFPAFPWEQPDAYLKRSPLSYVGNVKTPTMLLTGEEDYRTPISESEQFYTALKLRKVETALVRIPGASHSIAAKPSHLIAKVLHVLEWFRRHDQPGEVR